MTEHVTVRPAILSDASDIALLSSVLGYPVLEGGMLARLQRLLRRGEDVVLVAALSSGPVVGWVHGAEQELLESERRCEILGLVVDPQHRAQGIGRRLVTAVEAWAMSRGLTHVTVRSNVQRAESHPFYAQLGYVRTKTQHAYRKQISNHRPV